MLPICFVKAFDAGRTGLLDSIRNEAPSGYSDLLVRVLDSVSAHYDGDEDCDFDTGNIKSISSGSYQGTLYFLVPTNGYSESAYTARVGYGSCSHCDAFEAIQMSHDRYDDDGNECAPDDDACEAYARLALHIFQSLKKI